MLALSGRQLANDITDIGGICSRAVDGQKKKTKFAGFVVYTSTSLLKFAPWKTKDVEKVARAR